MNKREINEIKKLFTIKNCGITRLCGCYVDAEKNIKSQWEQFFPSLPEDQMIKYLDIIRKVLSGGLGKDNVNMDIREKGYMSGRMLQKMRDTQIAEESTLGIFYDFMISNLDYTGQYAILTAYGNYDIPGKTMDAEELEDESEEVYEFIITCICPVNLQKPGLVYDQDKGIFAPFETGRVLADPIVGVLYPAFNDRSQDIDAALCYCHNMSDGGRDILEKLTGSRIMLSAKEERAAYMEIVQNVLGEKTTIDEIKRVEEALQELKEEHADDLEQYSLGIEDMAMLFRNAEIDEARIGCLKEVYSTATGPGGRMTLDNLGHMRAFTIEMEEGKLVLNPNNADKAAVRDLDGIKVIVIPLCGSVNVNGIKIDIGEHQQKGR